MLKEQIVLELMILYFWKDFNESYKMWVLIGKIKSEYTMIKTQFLFKITLAMLFVYLCNSCNETIYAICVNFYWGSQSFIPLPLITSSFFFNSTFSFFQENNWGTFEKKNFLKCKFDPFCQFLEKIVKCFIWKKWI